MTRIIGIDPGSRRTGYGIVDVEAGKARYVTSGIIRLPEKSLPERLKIIFDGITQLVGQYHPAEMGIEEVFLSHNASSALKLGQARGAVLAALGAAGLEVAEYAPRLVKKALVGNGAAEKRQVQAMVERLLPGANPDSLDASDALAVAITHAGMAVRSKLVMHA